MQSDVTYTAACIFLYCKKSAYTSRTRTVRYYSRALAELPAAIILHHSPVPFYRRSDSSEVMEVYPLPFFFLSSLVYNSGINSAESYQRVITIEHNPLEIYMSIQFSYIRLFLVY